MKYSVFSTAMGDFAYVAAGRRLVATFLPRRNGDLRRAIRSDWPDAVEDAELLPEFRRQLNAYFLGKPVRFSASIDLDDWPPFFRNVLLACRKIPYGRTASYADLARAAGRPNAARAVGQAMARNPLPLVIPCHRVVSSDGSLGGFSSTLGVGLKQRLLALERNGLRRRRHVA